MTSRPFRVLHVVETMNRAGIETWLMHLLRSANRDEIAMDFLVHRSDEGHFDRELQRLGARRFVCAHPRRPWKYVPQFRSIVREHGAFDAIHSHVDHFTGAVMRIAEGLGVPVRVAHSHNDTTPLQQKAGVLRSRYFRLMNEWIEQYSTVRLAASRRAAAAMFPRGWLGPGRSRILPYGLDWSAFQRPYDSASVRAELGLAPEDFVIGHVGRFEPQKNHAFVLRVFAQVVASEPKARLLFVGDGSLRPEIEKKVSALGLRDRVRMAGVRSDIARVMKCAMDAFLFPSLFEGLGIVVVEAQAAGLPSVIADSIPDEAVVIPEICRRLELDQPIEAWAAALLASRSLTRPDNRVARIAASGFTVEANLRALREVYS